VVGLVTIVVKRGILPPNVQNPLSINPPRVVGLVTIVVKRGILPPNVQNPLSINPPRVVGLVTIVVKRGILPPCVHSRSNSVDIRYWDLIGKMGIFRWSFGFGRHFREARSSLLKVRLYGSFDFGFDFRDNTVKQFSSTTD
jgi:hypothetical protein